MNFPRARLIQFARYPEYGRVKTRLAPVLSQPGILRLHCQLVVATNRILQGSGLAPVELWYGGTSEYSLDDPFFRQLRAHRFVRQGEGGLGAKMLDAFSRTLVPTGEARCALLVGSDCPFINADILKEGLQALMQGRDLVLGPAEDGGYYLIGLRQPAAALFSNIPWGGPQVLNRTLDRVRHLGLDYHLLKKLPDIDTPQDIPKLTINPEYAWIEKEKNYNLLKNKEK